MPKRMLQHSFCSIILAEIKQHTSMILRVRKENRLWLWTVEIGRNEFQLLNSQPELVVASGELLAGSDIVF